VAAATTGGVEALTETMRGVVQQQQQAGAVAATTRATTAAPAGTTSGLAVASAARFAALTIRHIQVATGIADLRLVLLLVLLVAATTALEVEQEEEPR
jgi:hypothetical protein